ncbi:transglycosylase domain-containing protein, partial [bacterium]|nr:transglycosylase domain-containing protein [bacterium]
VIIWGIIFIIYFSRDLPSLEQLERYEPKLISKIYSNDNELIREISGEENRVWVPYDKMPQHLIDALIAAEDHSFYEHWGVNLYNFLGSLYINITSLKFERGFSTITMQLSRDITYLTRQKLIVRKIKEILTALKIEQTYTKREIIQMYLNQYDFGRMSFGIGSVSFTYFSKKAEDLTLEESALIISLLPAPTAYSPLKNMEISFKRRNLVLKCMLDMNYITEKEYKEAIVKPIILNVGYRSNEDRAPYFSEYIRKLVDEKSDELGINLYEDGLNIYTTLDLRLQKIAEESLLSQLDVMQKRLHWRLIKLHKETGADTTVQGSFIAIDPGNGHIMAMVGGKDYGKSQFSRATQSKRQPGSCFKPFVWTAAIDNGYSPNYELWDQELSLPQYDAPDWRPQNYTKKRGGLTTIREGLRKSLNN